MNARTPPVRRSAHRAAISAEAARPDRRQAILLAAEKLFAQHGYHAVTIRQIAEEAGVPLALVGYYFGPKADLYQQIYRERAGYIRARLEALATAQEQAPKGRLLEEIVKAFVLPVLAVAASPDGRNFLRLVSRSMSDQIDEDEAVVRDLFDPLAHAFIDAIHKASPHTSRGTAAWCYQFALGALILHVTDKRVERLSFGENHPDDGATAGPLLVRFITAGIRNACGPGVH